jgi:acetyltransferase-like isoleucine patch superfamily enzyme
MINKLLKNIINGWKHFFSTNLQLARLQHKYPNSHFYKGAQIHNTTFEGNNIVFNDVLLESCCIGRHSYIQKHSRIFNAAIGRFCSIASGVSIAPGIHKTDRVSTHPVFYIYNTPLTKKFAAKDAFEISQKVNIGHDVWIGENAIIIDGVSIGSGAIIAAGAIVNKDVAPYSIVGGVPAKVLKYRFDEQTINALMKMEWWNYSDEWLEANHLLFANPKDLLSKKLQ